MANQTPPTTEELKVINKALEERIIEANKDKTKWKRVLPDLMAADIFVVAQVSDRTDANGNRLMNMLMMTDNKGHEIVPFFTSPARMAVLATPTHKTFNVMKLNTVRFFQSIRGKTSVLNPKSTASRIFTPFDMNVLVMENLDKIPKDAAPEKEPKNVKNEKADENS